MENIVKNIKITIDNDTKNYEVNNFLKKTINLFLLPILNRLPRRLFVKSSKKAEEVHKHVTTHKALEVIYSFNHQLSFENGILDGLFHYFWQKTSNAKALRNRLRLAKKELEKAIHLINKKEIRILNLAAGTNRGVVEIVGIHKDKFDFKVFAVDKSEFAIEDARKLTSIFDVAHLFNFHNEKISDFFNKNNNIKFDIIEMVGFLDYLEDKKAVDLFNKIYSALTNNGIFITGNIKDNQEKKLITEVLGWPGLIFRHESDLLNILSASKFELSDIEIIYEPLNIHGVIVCKKK